MSPLRAGQILEQLSHACFSFIATASASFVALTRVYMHGLVLLLRDHHRCIIQISGCDRCDTGSFGRRIVIDQSNTVDYNRGY